MHKLFLLGSFLVFPTVASDSLFWTELSNDEISSSQELEYTRNCLEISKDLNRLLKNSNQELRTENENLRMQNENLWDENFRLKTNISDKNVRILKLKKVIGNYQDNNFDLKNKLTDCQLKLDNLRAQNKELSDKLCQREEAFKLLSKENEVLKSDYESQHNYNLILQKKIQALEIEIKKKDEKILSLTSSRDAIASNNKVLKEKMKNLTTQIEPLLSENETLKKQAGDFQSLKIELDDKIKLISSYEKLISVLREENKYLEKHKDDKDARFVDLNAKTIQLMQDKEDLKKERDKLSETIDFLIKQFEGKTFSKKKLLELISKQEAELG